MNLRALALFLCFLALPFFAHAKRLEAAAVAKLKYHGLLISAPNDDGRRGYLRIEDEKTGKLVEEITLYRVKINPELETDVQWVFIQSMNLDANLLTVTDEKHRVYVVNLDTRKVVKK